MTIATQKRSIQLGESNLFPVDLRADAYPNKASGSFALRPYNGSIEHITLKSTYDRLKYTYSDTATADEGVLTDQKQRAFNLSASDIVKGVLQGEESILKKIQDVNFRFPSTVAGDLIDASDLSEAFAIVLATARLAIAKKGAAKSIEQRGSKADQYATELFKEVEKLKADHTDSLSLRKTAELLTEKGIRTPTNKGKWHAATLIALRKRWEELNLTPHKPKL